MAPSILTRRARTLNAKVAALALATGAFLTLSLSHTSASLAPLRVMALAIVAFASWAFSDEMGLRKPLNRAGLTFFVIAAATKVQITLGVAPQVAGRYILLYAAFLLLAVLSWSLAFLHRQRELKIVGAVGLLAALAPIVAIVLGHMVVGVGVALGINGLLDAAQGTPPGDTHFLTLVERIFGLWGYVTAWLLWRGHIVDRQIA